MKTHPKKWKLGDDPQLLDAMRTLRSALRTKDPSRRHSLLHVTKSKFETIAQRSRPSTTLVKGR